MNSRRIAIVAQAAALVTLGVIATSVPSMVQAESGPELMTRSPVENEAELNRAAMKPGDTKPGVVRTRSIEDIHADQMRDWGAKPSGTFGANVRSRSVAEAYDDLIRAGFGPNPPASSTAHAVAATK
jgi:hypothetical protein